MEPFISFQLKEERLHFNSKFVVYYESVKREPKIRGIYECRCDERLHTKNKGIYASPIHWVGLGTGTPKDRDEVNKRDVCECDG